MALRVEPVKEQWGALHLSAPNALARHVLIHTTDRDVVATAMPQILRQEGQHYALAGWRSCSR